MMDYRTLPGSPYQKDYYHSARHWAPSLLISLVGNLLLLQLITWLIFAEEPQGSTHNRQAVSLVVSKVQPLPPPVKPPEKSKPVVKKNKITTKKKAVKPKKTVKNPHPKPVAKPQTKIVEIQPQETAAEDIPPMEPELVHVVEDPVESPAEPSLNPSQVVMMDKIKPVEPEPIKATPLFLVTKRPVAVYTSEPQYPEERQKFNEEGVVLASWIVDTDGSAKQIEIIESSGKEFDEAVIAAIRSSKFLPGFVNDQAVAVKVRKEFTFKLD